MNKAKLILPIAALAMTPLFTSCKDSLIAVLLYLNNCRVYKYGPSTCHIEIDQNSEASKDVKFRKDIKSEHIKEPTGSSKLAGKAIKSISVAEDSKAIDITFDGTLKADVPFGTLAAIRVEKEAFEQKTAGGLARLELCENQYLVHHYDDTTGNCIYELASSGGDFKKELISTQSSTKIFDTNENGYFKDADGELIGVAVADWPPSNVEAGYTLTISELAESSAGHVYKMSVAKKESGNELPDHPNLIIGSVATQIGEVEVEGLSTLVVSRIAPDKLISTFAADYPKM